MDHPPTAGNAFLAKRARRNAERPVPVTPAGFGFRVLCLRPGSSMAHVRVRLLLGQHAPCRGEDDSVPQPVRARIAVSVRSPPGSPPVTGTTATSSTPASA